MPIHRYKNIPTYITENGLAWQADTVEEAVNDTMRQQYLHDHIDAVGQALPLTHRLAISAAKQAQVGKLDWDKVRTIRASTETRKALAERYGVSTSLIGQVLRN